MNDERFLKDWLRDTTDSAAGPNAMADKVVARLPDTPQRRRWLPWPPAHRSDPDAPRRNRSMLNPVNAMLMGALTLLAGGTFLVVQPLSDEPGSDVHSAITLERPVEFTGRFIPADSVRDPAYETGEGVLHVRGAAWTPIIGAMSEPMLDGQLIYMEDEDRYSVAGISLSAITYRIENDEGAWQGTAIEPSGTGTPFTDNVVLVGEDAYEGLYAVMQQSDGEVRGVIFPGPPPEPSDVPPLPADG